MFESGLQAPASCVCIWLQWPFRAVRYFFFANEFPIGYIPSVICGGERGGLGACSCVHWGGGAIVAASEKF